MELGNLHKYYAFGRIERALVFLALSITHISCTGPDLIYIDKTGAEIPWVNTEEIRAFADGLAKNGIDSQPKELIKKHGGLPPIFYVVSDFTQDLLPYWNGTKWVYVNRMGDAVLEGDWLWANPFSEGLACVVFKTMPDGTPNSHKLVAYIDEKGNRVIGEQYEGSFEFSEGRAVVYKNGQFGMIDSQGNVCVDVNYIELGTLREGLAPFTINTNNKTVTGFMNKDGEHVLVLPNFSWSPQPFSHGLAAVKFSDHFDKYCYIDKTGTERIGPRFDDAHEFNEGLAAVKVGKKWGFIDTSGAMIIEPQFLEAYDFKNGVAVVVK